MMRAEAAKDEAVHRFQQQTLSKATVDLGSSSCGIAGWGQTAQHVVVLLNLHPAELMLRDQCSTEACTKCSPTYKTIQKNFSAWVSVAKARKYIPTRPD
eukprot:1146752-Pelagomonas_calceolata.AAC.2